jgi:uncharacterized protein YciI
MTDTPQFIYVIRPTRPEMLTEGPTPEEQATVADHFAYLQELTERGVVVLAGRTTNDDDSSFGIVVFKADDGDAARRLMESDPAVARGVMSAELFPYRVALMGRL